jgi:hypothetical protein
MENITKVSASTKADKSAAEAVITNMVIDWSGMTPEDVRAMAQAGLVIKLQSQFRRDAKKGVAIPKELKVKAYDHRVGTRTVKVEKPLIERIAELSDAERAALIAQLTGG